MANDTSGLKLAADLAANDLMFFKRLLTIWFVLFTLISSASWAAGDHVSVRDATQAVDEQAHPLLLPTWADDGCDDHCDHAGAHIIALTSSPVEVSFIAAVPVIQHRANKPVSHQPPPPFNPPIV